MAENAMIFSLFLSLDRNQHRLPLYEVLYKLIIIQSFTFQCQIGSATVALELNACHDQPRYRSQSYHLDHVFGCWSPEKIQIEISNRARRKNCTRALHPVSRMILCIPNNSRSSFLQHLAINTLSGKNRQDTYKVDEILHGCGNYTAVSTPLFFRRSLALLTLVSNYSSISIQLGITILQNNFI